MLKIAYCDDMEQDRDRVMWSLNRIEEQWNETFEIYSFNSGESLLETVAENIYDIILLDIMMDGIDGVKTAKSIRRIGINSKIIFVSSCDDRIRELFSVGTVAFLDKPLKTEELQATLKEAVGEIQKDRSKAYAYKNNKDLNYLQLDTIKFFESRGPKVHIETTSGEVSFYGALKDVLDGLGDNPDFIMPHRAYVVNFKYTDISKNELTIKGSDVKITIGRGKRGEILDKFMIYMQRKGEF